MSDDDKKLEKMLDKIDVELTRLNLGNRYETGRQNISLKNEAQCYGLCGMCKSFGFAKTQYSVKIAKCSFFEIRLSSGDAMVECSAYEERNTMTIRDMAEIAHIIELGSNPIGFKRKCE